MENDYAMLIATISEQFDTDEVSYSRRGRNLLQYYRQLPKHDQEMIDQVFIILTGWTLNTLIVMSEVE